MQPFLNSWHWGYDCTCPFILFYVCIQLKNTSELREPSNPLLMCEFIGFPRCDHWILSKFTHGCQLHHFLLITLFFSPRPVFLLININLFCHLIFAVTLWSIMLLSQDLHLSLVLQSCSSWQVPCEYIIINLPDPPRFVHKFTSQELTSIKS